MESSHKKAWFSSSVPEFCKKVWLKRNGKIVSDILCADFIFAKNPEADDIAWFYKTKFFLQEGIMPFNSAWLKNPSKKIIDFILYPKGFQERNFPQEWDFVDEQDDMQFHHLKDFKSAKSIAELTPSLDTPYDTCKQSTTSDPSLDCNHNIDDEGSKNTSVATSQSTLKTKKNIRRSSNVPTSILDLEVHSHGFYSSMHDGFLHVDDIHIPDGMQLEDFQVNSNSYQVFLIDPP